jgi:hypothetical protein
MGTLTEARAGAEEAEAPPAPYDLATLDCGELDAEAGLRPMRVSHIAGEDLDVLCKVTVTLPQKTKGSPKAHTVKLTIMQGQKVAFEQVRDVRVLNAGSRVILFVIPAEKLPTDPGKVNLRVELSKPASKPAFREIAYELVSED